MHSFHILLFILYLEKKTQLSDYQELATIHYGTFGNVYLVLNKLNRRLYAMKTI